MGEDEMREMGKSGTKSREAMQQVWLGCRVFEISTELSGDGIEYEQSRDGEKQEKSSLRRQTTIA